MKTMYRLSVPPPRAAEGNVMILVLLTFTVLSMLAASTIMIAMRNYRAVTQVGNWQEALLAAESGIDTAMAELRTTLSSPADAFASWSTTDANGNILPNNGRSYTPTALSPGGNA